MKFHFSSLKVKLLLWVLPIIIVGMLFMGFAAFSYINRVIENELSVSMLKAVQRSADLVNKWLETLMVEPETIASTPAAKHINESFELFDQQNINRHLALHLKYPDIFRDIYGSNRQGVYHTVRSDGGKISIFKGDISNRPYFISIMNGAPTQITEPLVSRTTKIPTIFIVAPIIDENNKPVGLVGTGISLKYIQEIVKEVKSGESSYGFIFTENGTLVAHSEIDIVTRENMNISDLFPETALVNKLQSDNTGMFRYQDNNQDVVFFYKEIPMTGWKMVSVISSAELFAPAHQMIGILILIALITLVITGSAVYITTRQLIKPLRSFVEKTKEIAAGNYQSEEFVVHSNDEIGALSDSFNIMMENLNDSISRLRESEDNYRGIFSNSMEGILQITLEGTILNANPAMIHMLHCKSIEDMKQSYNNLKEKLYINPEDRDRLIQLIIEKGRVKQKEIQYRCKDGETIWVSVSSLLIQDESGKPVRIESLISDITERKIIEQEKEKLFEELVQAQKLEAVGQLAGGVAHDFNNMLAVILGRAELSLLKMDKSDPIHDSLVEIYDAADHSVNLTRQLLAFARKQSATPEVININKVIRNMHKLLRRLINEDVELTFIPGEEIWDIYIDPDQVGQILTNMCVNARDSIEGIGKITIKTENVVINSEISRQIEGIPPGDYICLSVEDTGSGMDKETQEHIFEPFFTTKELGKGTGLGLSTIYGIVKQNNGRINVYSEPESGTVFKIYLPRHSGPQTDKDQKSCMDETPVSAGTILLVEDDPRLLGLTRVILESIGCRVISAEAPAKAIKIAQNMDNQFDLLFTDVVMPQMNGHELFLKISEIRPGIKCLFMSGYSSDILAPKGIIEKDINFIQKPFTLKGLTDKINAIMKKKE